MLSPGSVAKDRKAAPATKKEKKAATAARFSELEVGQLVEGVVASVKPYGYFIDLGGISGLLHHSCVTGAELRDLREAFSQSGRRLPHRS